MMLAHIDNYLSDLLRVDPASTHEVTQIAWFFEVRDPRAPDGAGQCWPNGTGGAGP
jgi:hypothetical protein